MPSDTHIQQALDALAAPRESFRSAVAMAVDQVGAFIAAHRAPANGRAERTAHELGPFAASRLDASRFATFFGESGTLDPLALARIEHAYEKLSQIAGLGDDLYVARVAPGANLRTQVAHTLAEIGRVFGAARTIEMARLGRYPAEAHESYISSFAFRKWNRAERQIAPPIVVDVEGADLQVGGLTEFLDGTQKIVLVVCGAAPSAPLVRLITPGVFVMQSTDEADLKQLTTVAGPAIFALMPEGAARFVHTPGDAPVWERLSVQFVPEQEPRTAVGSFGVFQQLEELKQLRALAGPPTPQPSPSNSEGRGSTPVSAEAEVAVLPSPSIGGGAGGGGLERRAAPAADPADKLAAWLLSQTDLSGT
jgi:hypothetical protein